MSITKILVAIDGSEHAAKALDFALDLAEKYSAEIVLVGVISPTMVPMAYPSGGVMPIPPTAFEDFSKDLKASYDKILSVSFEKAKKVKPRIKVSRKLLQGRVADEIIQVVEKENVDLVVMGSRGLGGIKEFFLGSVSHRVADGVSCPVLIVK